MCLSAGNPGPLTGAGNNTWLLDGAEPTLIDAGVGGAAHVDALANQLAGRALARVLITHGHPDHASGAPALRARWPGVEIWKWPPVPDESWRMLGEGREVQAGDTVVETLHTPGHAVDHVCFWHAETESVFVGDLMASGTTIVVPAGRGGHLRSYLSSLERIAALDAGIAYPGHGPVIEKPNVLIADYLEHRRLRERQVLSLVRGGVLDPDELVARIYPGLPAEIRATARETIEAHLIKLYEDDLIPKPPEAV